MVKEEKEVEGLWHPDKTRIQKINMIKNPLIYETDQLVYALVDLLVTGKKNSKEVMSKAGWRRKLTEKLYPMVYTYEMSLLLDCVTKWNHIPEYIRKSIINSKKRKNAIKLDKYSLAVKAKAPVVGAAMLAALSSQMGEKVHGR